MYVGASTKIYEVDATTFTDVSRATAYDNTTHGPSFAAYGNKCYHSNGIDRINSINVPATCGTSANFSDITYTTDGAVIAPKYICSHKNHLIGANIKMLAGYGEIDTATSTSGIAFTNQPSNDTVTIVSANAGDVGQKITIRGTTHGTDTIVSENIVTNGLTPVAGSTLFGKVLRVTNNSVTGNAGIITIKETSGGATITTIPISGAAAHVGNYAVSIAAGDSYVTLVADASTTTAQIGIEGTDSEGNAIYDSQALNSITPVSSNSKFRTVTNLYIGDLEVARTVTITSHQFALNEQYEYLVWISGTDLPEGYGDPQVAPQIPGSDYRYLFDGIGTITGIADGGDCFFVFKSGSVTRFDGPPFQPTVISYNIGMRLGNTAYRNGDRIYFWSSKGLSYIDIKSNEIVHIFEDSMQRSVLDGGSSGSLGSNSGYFPEQNITTISGATASAKSTTARVTISGDPEYNLLFISYYSGTPCYGSSDIAILCYNEKLDSFSLIDAPVGNQFTPLLLSFDNDAVSSFPGSSIRLFRMTDGTTNLTMFSFQSLGMVGSSGTQCPYIRYPFKSVDPQSSRSRIRSVRPIFDNISTAGVAATMAGTRIEVLSISGTSKSWTASSVLSLGVNSYSKDGWYGVDNCPYADKHSIGVHFQATAAVGVPRNEMIVAGLVGVEIEFELKPSRSL
jgi:hypothetical protein